MRSDRPAAGGLLLGAMLLLGCSESGEDGGAAGAGRSGSGGVSSGGAGAGGAPAGTGGGATAGAGGSPGAAALAACRTFCAAEEACDPETTLAECETAECVNPVNPSQSLADAPVDCQQALTGYFTCLAESDDACDRDGCPGSSDAVVSACF